jgi:serine/threonine protein kinase
VTSNDWKRVKELFTSVVALAEGERDSYLAAQSDSNEVLNEVSSLLSTYLESPDFLEGVTPPLPLGDLADEAPATLAGRRIGAWQLIREIGRGGMGVVWEAHRADQQYDQRAAVKLLRASLLSEREIRRFREERQILASLNHPCIARLLDGGMMERPRAAQCPQATRSFSAGMFGRRIRSPPVGHPSRSEAGQHPGHGQRWHAEAARFRHCQIDSGGR